MRSLYPIHVDIIIRKHGTSHRCNAYCNLGSPHLFDDFRYQFMHNPVAASGTIVHMGVVEKFRLLINSVLGFYYILNIHIALPPLIIC